MKTMIVGPFLGELEWEMVSWEPFIRNVFLVNNYKDCIIFGKKNRSLLYPFAKEYIELSDSFFINFAPIRGCVDIIDDTEAHMSSIMQELQKYFTKYTELVWYSDNMNPYDKMYIKGRQYLLDCETIAKKDVFISNNITENCDLNKIILNFSKYKIIICYDFLSAVLCQKMGKPFIYYNVSKSSKDTKLLEEYNWFGNDYKIVYDKKDIDIYINNLLNNL